MGPVLVRLSSIITMRAFVLVVLSLAAVHADSDAYTIGQVATGHTNGGVVTGVDYGHGLVSGVGALGNRGVYAGYAGYLGYAAPYGHYGYAGYYGKREADSEAFTIGQVAAGLPVANAYATLHPHNVGVVTGTSYSAPVYAGHVGYAGHLGYAGHAVAAPAAYGHYGYAGYYGKREAEADSEAYTIGQVAAGLPVANAYATGHPHNVGVITGHALAAPAAYGHYGYAGYY